MTQTFLTFLLFCMSSSMAFSADPAENKPQDEIIRTIEQWPKDFNDKNLPAVCALFAPDLVASYQGTGDKSYGDMCRSLTEALTNANRTFTYAKPEIEQIIMRDDLAVVRVIWTLQVTDNHSGKTELVKEKGLDVFKRQNDGSWKIAVSYAYPLKS